MKTYSPLDSLRDARAARFNPKPDWHTDLHDAANDGDIQKIEQCLNQGIPINCKTEIGDYTPLHLAAMEDKAEAVEYLIAKGATINTQDREESSPLHVACTKGNLKSARVLLDAGANPNIQDRDEKSPLHTAAASGHYECVLLLLKRGASPALLDYEGSTPLHNCAEAGWSVHQSTQLLIERGESTLATTQGLEDADQSLLIAKALLNAGSSLDEQNKKKETPLHLAANSDWAPGVKFLLSKRANPNNVTIDGWTPLHEAACTGSPEIIELLLNAGAKCNTVESHSGKTPLEIITESWEKEGLRGKSQRKVKNLKKGMDILRAAKRRLILTAIKPTKALSKTQSPSHETDVFEM